MFLGVGRVEETDVGWRSALKKLSTVVRTFLQSHIVMFLLLNNIRARCNRSFLLSRSVNLLSQVDRLKSAIDVTV